MGAPITHLDYEMMLGRPLTKQERKEFNKSNNKFLVVAAVLALSFVTYAYLFI